MGVRVRAHWREKSFPKLKDTVIDKLVSSLAHRPAACSCLQLCLLDLHHPQQILDWLIFPRHTSIQLNTPMSVDSDPFNQAVAFISSSNASSSSEAKLCVSINPSSHRRRSTAHLYPLKLYSLFKISTASRLPSTSRPSVFDFQGRAKFDAWQKLGSEERFEGEDGQEKAKEEYLDEAKKLGWKGFGAETGGSTASDAEVGEKGKGAKGMVSVSKMAEEVLPEG